MPLPPYQIKSLLECESMSIAFFLHPKWWLCANHQHHQHPPTRGIIVVIVRRPHTWCFRFSFLVNFSNLVNPRNRSTTEGAYYKIRPLIFYLANNNCPLPDYPGSRYSKLQWYSMVLNLIGAPKTLGWRDEKENVVRYPPLFCLKREGGFRSRPMKLTHNSGKIYRFGLNWYMRISDSS
jgi:hypothetical protein